MYLLNTCTNENRNRLMRSCLRSRPSPPLPRRWNLGPLYSLLVVGHPVRCTPASPPVISFVTSGPEATGAKNNIRVVDRQPNNDIKPGHPLRSSAR